MSRPVAILAPTVRMASVLAPLVSEGLPDALLVPFSLATYLDAERPPRNVVLCPPGSSVARGVAFLRRAAARLLWPAPPPRVAEAIEGIRPGDESAIPSAALARPRRPGARGGASLLLEGRVDAARARVALRHSRTRDWIVESVGSVRLSPRALAHAASEGVRWSVLEPVIVEGMWATPDLARARRSWRALLPPKTPVWIRGEGTPRRRTSRGRAPSSRRW